MTNGYTYPKECYELGLSFANISPQDLAALWLENKREEAKTDKYVEVVLDRAVQIIEEKSYGEVYNLLEKLDKLQKKNNDRILGNSDGSKGPRYIDAEYPLWAAPCCCAGALIVEE